MFEIRTRNIRSNNDLVVKFDRKYSLGYVRNMSLERIGFFKSWKTNWKPHFRIFQTLLVFEKIEQKKNVDRMKFRNVFVLK